MNALLLMASGREILVKGSPAEAEEKIRAGRKPETNYDYNLNNDTVSCVWTEPRFTVFEAARERREIRIRVDLIEAIAAEYLPQERTGPDGF